VYRSFLRTPEGKGPLERRKIRWDGNIKMDLGEIRLDGLDWINLALDRD
jgi:hypothetical protein